MCGRLLVTPMYISQAVVEISPSDRRIFHAEPWDAPQWVTARLVRIPGIPGALTAAFQLSTGAVGRSSDEVVERVRQSVRIEPIPGSGRIAITVRTPDALLSAAIANEFTRHLMDADPQRYTALVDPAKPALKSTTPDTAPVALFGGFCGLLLGWIAAIVPPRFRVAAEAGRPRSFPLYAHAGTSSAGMGAGSA